MSWHFKMETRKIKKRPQAEKNEWCSIIIPAHNEQRFISGCLESLLSQESSCDPAEVIVVPNGCTDATSEIARSYFNAFQARGWTFKVHELSTGNKVAALNAGDRIATNSTRIYIDADIQCSRTLLGDLRKVLNTSKATYATGRLELKKPKNWITKNYGSCWKKLPFVRYGAVGAGFYGVNAEGRARWGLFPSIIADDSFARLQFTPDERVEVSSIYHWPMAEGFLAIVRVRRRQDSGMRELLTRFPDLEKNEGKPPVTISYFLDLMLRSPLPLIIYVIVSIAVRIVPTTKEWARGR